MRKLKTQKEIMATWEGDPTQPLVSICCTAYNHERFIEDALEGFLIQKTDFPFEILIHDDASTDRTAEIVRKYEAEYPNLIKPIYQTENQYSQGIKPMDAFIFPRVKSHYLSLCEGDDYWTDPNKLQKQIDFLEKNKEFTVCAHLVENFYQDKSKPSFIFPYPEIQKDIYTIEDFLVKNYMNTCSVVYRWIFHYYPKPPWINQHFTQDYVLHCLHACYGNIKMLPEVMARYRKHSGGVMSGTVGEYQVFKVKNRISFMNNINEYSNHKYDEIIQEMLCRYKYSLANALLDEKKNEESRIVFNDIKEKIKFKEKIKYLIRFKLPNMYKYTKQAYKLLLSKIN